MQRSHSLLFSASDYSLLLAASSNYLPKKEVVFVPSAVNLPGIWVVSGC